MTVLLALLLGCGTKEDSGQTDVSMTGALPRELPFWDLEPDTGWMAEYPIVDCPWPGPDDVVVELVTYESVIDFYQGTLIFDMDAISIGDGDCSMMYDVEELNALGIPYLRAQAVIRYPSFSEGKLEGDQTVAASIGPHVSVQYHHLDEFAQLDSSTYDTVTYPGDTPYSDFCLSRVRPYRIVGAWRLEAPPPHQDAAGWPPSVGNSVYLWWDFQWGEHVDSVFGLTCFHVFYEGGTTPQDAWPDMPEGWSHEDTWPP